MTLTPGRFGRLRLRGARARGDSVRLRRRGDGVRPLAHGRVQGGAARLGWNASVTDGGILQEFGQGFRDMSPAMDTLEAELLNQRIRHGGNPILKWCAANAIAVKDPAGNRKLDKAKSTGRIDGIVALTMAMGASRGRAGRPVVLGSRRMKWLHELARLVPWRAEDVHARAVQGAVRQPHLVVRKERHLGHGGQCRDRLCLRASHWRRHRAGAAEAVPGSAGWSVAGSGEDHPLYRVLHRRPNEFQTSFEYRQTLGLYLVLTGNAISFIERAPGSGRISG
jgi:hypothetical protein